MDTDCLIDRLAEDMAPVGRHARAGLLALGLAGGGIVTLAMVVAALGIRPDLRVAMHGFSFWMKGGYTISLGVAAAFALARLARPEPVLLARFRPVALPFLGLALVGVAELASTPRADWLALWLGGTWRICPWLVLALSAPMFAGLLWSFRHLAPTRLRAAGAAAGLTAGAWAAALYCLHCPETSALFVLTWYTLGILLATGAGALLGPSLLRW